MCAEAESEPSDSAVGLLKGDWRLLPAAKAKLTAASLVTHAAAPVRRSVQNWV